MTEQLLPTQSNGVTTQVTKGNGSVQGKLNTQADAISLFKTQAPERRFLHNGRLEQRMKDLGAPSNYDQKPWGLLYKVLIDSLGTSPQNFQMIYPFTPWNWSTEVVGSIGSAQYDFCSTIPQWSAVGSYTSSGDRFNQAYQEFLNVIVAATDDPQLRIKIQEAYNVSTQASNDYITVQNQVTEAYHEDPNVVDNQPPFSKWLGSPAGKGWQSQMTRAETKMNQAQKNYDALVYQANTPGLSNAQAQFKNEDFYAKLNDPGLKEFPKVPNWSVSQNAQQWVDRVKAGQGPASAEMGFSNRDASYDYSQTWAKGSLSIKQFFWYVQVNGTWERVEEFESDNELNVSVQFEALDLIQIQPSDWYNSSFVRSKANGPFTRGYSADGGDGTQAVFGEKGFIGLLKTGMYVGYKPTFTITTSQSTFESFQEKFTAATGLRIGPFTFTASGGSEKSSWTASESGKSFTGTSTSETPMIIGISIAELPNQKASDASLNSSEKPRGICYRFSGFDGDVLAENIIEEHCTQIGGESWEPALEIGDN